MTFSMSEKIIEMSKLDYKLRIRLAGESNLIAAEAKYHLGCFSSLKRSCDKTRSKLHDNDVPLVWLSEEIEYAAKKGHVSFTVYFQG